MDASDLAPNDAGDADEMADAVDAGPSIAEQLGILVYDNATTPIVESEDGAVTTYTWAIEDGPRCMRGEPYRASVRDTDSDDLVIFLQGGGACWSDFCLAVNAAPAGIPNVDILDSTLEENPVADWDAVYLPYCDGSFFAGDTAIDDDLNGKGTRHHRGLANLSAAVDVAAERFPSPERILLAGSSGGAYGLLLAAPLVRHHYPDAELILMFDSGIGLARSGDPSFIQLPVDEFGLGDFIPDDCDGCITSGHLTALVSWYLERDDNVRAGFYSSWRDSVLAGTFLRVDAADFAESVLVETGAVHEAFPDRFRRFIAAGTQHTSLLGDPTGIIGSRLDAVELPEGAIDSLLGGDLVIEGLAATRIGDIDMATWLGALVDGDTDVWVDLVEEDEQPTL
jgi:hypothetical protein